MNDIVTADKEMVERMLHRANCLEGAAEALRKAAKTIQDFLGLNGEARAEAVPETRAAPPRPEPRPAPAPMLSGVWPKLAGTEAALLAFQRAAGFHTTESLLAALQKRYPRVSRVDSSNYLYRLKAKNLVRKEARGAWRLVEGKGTGAAGPTILDLEKGAARAVSAAKAVASQDYEGTKAALLGATVVPADPEILERKRRMEEEA